MTRYLVIPLILLLSRSALADPCNCEVIDPGKERRRTAKIVAASGLGAMGASFAVSVYARHKYTDAIERIEQLDSAPYDPANNGLRSEATNDANDAHDLAKFGGTALFAAGAIALGAATYLYLTAPSKEIVRRTAIAPTAGQGYTGITLMRAF